MRRDQRHTQPENEQVKSFEGCHKSVLIQYDFPELSVKLETLTIRHTGHFEPDEQTPRREERLPTLLLASLTPSQRQHTLRRDTQSRNMVQTTSLEPQRRRESIFARVRSERARETLPRREMSH